MPTTVQLPFSEEKARAVRAGEVLALSGVLYTARDAAHKRLVQALQAGERLPIQLEDQTIYYCGPTPAPPGRVIGAAGPTTSSRMDPYAPTLYAAGVRATIGKGERSRQVRLACKQYGCLYLVAVGGAGALLGDRVVEAEAVAYHDLGPEAIHRLRVEQMPVIVAYDTYGGSVFPGEEAI